MTMSRAIRVSVVCAAAVTMLAGLVVSPAGASQSARVPSGQVPYTPAAEPDALPYTPGQLVFTQFNVCKTQCASPAPSWDVRRERMERALTATTSDVIGINEATNYSTSTAKTQWEDVQQVMASHGYAATLTVEDQCARPRNASGQLTGASPCEHSTGLLYRTETVMEVSPPSGSASSGATMVSRIAPGVDADSGAREVNWGFLQAKDGSTPPFLAVSLHLSTVKDAVHEQSRVLAAQGLTGWASAKIAEAGLPATTPVVLMGDLNSYQKRQPNGAQKVLTDAGWTDAYATARTVVNPRWSSVNETPQTVPWSGPVYFYYSTKNPVTRIDYIMVRGAVPVRYETVMFLKKDRTRIPEYAASDHNPIRATVQF